MSVVIRMKRTGRRNRPCYRISVADKAFPRDGRTLETLGVYDPVSPKPELQLAFDVERARYWVLKGAVPSHTVRSIFRKGGVYEGVSEPKKRTRKGRNKVTATRSRRETDKAARTSGKTERRTQRVAARRAAKKAAASESAES